MEPEVGWERRFAGVFVAVLCTFAGFGVVVPVLPRLVTGELGGSAALVGAAFATTAAVAFVVRPYAGQLAQRVGCRPVMMAGAAMACGAAACYPLPWGTPGLIVVRVTIGVAEAAVMTAGAVWAVSLAPLQRRGRVVGWYGLSMWGGLSLGPLLGDLAATGSTAYVWVVAAGLPAVAVLVLTRLPRGAGLSGAVSGRLLPPAAVRPGLALAAGGAGYACIISFGALAMTDRGLAGGSLLLSLFSAAYVAVRLLAVDLPDRIGATRVIVLAAVVETAGLALIAVAPNLLTAITGAVVAGGGFTLLYPSLALIAISRTPEAERGATLGAISSMLDVSIVAIGLAGGLAANLGYPLVFGSAAALAVLSLIAVVSAGSSSTRQ